MKKRGERGEADCMVVCTGEDNVEYIEKRLKAAAAVIELMCIEGKTNHTLTLRD